MNFTPEDYAWLLVGGALAVLAIMSPFIHRVWRQFQDRESMSSFDSSIPMFSLRNLDEMVKKGLLTPEEAERVRARTREKANQAIQERLAAEKAKAAAAPPPTAATPMDPIMAAIAKAKAEGQAAPKPAPVPKAPPQEIPEKPRVPERLVPLLSKSDAELEDLSNAGFLSEEDYAIVREGRNS